MLRHPVGIDVQVEEGHPVGLDAEDGHAQADDRHGEADLGHLQNNKVVINDQWNNNAVRIIYPKRLHKVSFG